MLRSLNEQIFEKHTIIESDKSKLPSGVLCRVAYPICNIGMRNKNERIYEKAVWDKVFADPEISEKQKNRSLFGQAEHPDVTQSNLEKTSHVITGTYYNKDHSKVMQEMDILDTPYGRIIDTLLEAKCMVGVSTRAEGEMEEAEDADGKTYSRVIPEQYDYRTTDFTAEPSTINPYPEKVERELVSQIQVGIETKKVDQKFATALLENLKCGEAKVLLESMKKEVKEESDKYRWDKAQLMDLPVEELESLLSKAIEIADIGRDTDWNPVIDKLGDVLDAKKNSVGKPDWPEEQRDEYYESKKGKLAFECFADMVKFLEKEFAENDDFKIKINNLVNESTGEDVVPESGYACKGCTKKFESESELNAEGLCPECAIAIKDISMESIDMEMKDIQISEASVRAERDKAFDMLCEHEKTQVITDQSHNTEIGIILANIDKLGEATSRKINMLYSTLKKRVKELKSLELELSTLKESHERELNILIHNHVNELAQLKHESIKETITNYIKMKVESRGLTIPKNSQALLEECDSMEEVDALLEKIVDALREGALHSQKLTEMEVDRTENVSPEVHRVDKSIGKAFAGFYGN